MIIHSPKDMSNLRYYILQKIKINRQLLSGKNPVEIAKDDETGHPVG
jgi:hypothetical protein